MAPTSLTSTYKLNSGYEIPVVGFGVYQTPADLCKGLVLKALESGYRHIDCARAYKNELECGNAIRESGLKRSEIFYTSKLKPQPTYEAAKAEIEESLKLANIGYIDLILLHCPYGGKQARLESWRALADAKKSGKVRSLGVSNYAVRHLDELEAYTKELGVTIDVAQYELHPWLTLTDIVHWLKEHSVVVEAYSPLIRGHKMDDPRVTSLAKKYGKTGAQVLVRWSLQQGFVTLPKTATLERVAPNVNVFDFELSPEDLEALNVPVVEHFHSCWNPMKDCQD